MSPSDVYQQVRRDVEARVSGLASDFETSEGRDCLRQQVDALLQDARAALQELERQAPTRGAMTPLDQKNLLSGIDAELDEIYEACRVEERQAMVAAASESVSVPASKSNGSISLFPLREQTDISSQIERSILDRLDAYLKRLAEQVRQAQHQKIEAGWEKVKAKSRRLGAKAIEAAEAGRQLRQKVQEEDLPALDEAAQDLSEPEEFEALPGAPGQAPGLQLPGTDAVPAGGGLAIPGTAPSLRVGTETERLGGLTLTLARPDSRFGIPPPEAVGAPSLEEVQETIEQMRDRVEEARELMQDAVTTLEMMGGAAEDLDWRTYQTLERVPRDTEKELRFLAGDMEEYEDLPDPVGPLASEIAERFRDWRDEVEFDNLLEYPSDTKDERIEAFDAEFDSQLDSVRSSLESQAQTAAESAAAQAASAAYERTRELDMPMAQILSQEAEQATEQKWQTFKGLVEEQVSQAAETASSTTGGGSFSFSVSTSISINITIRYDLRR